MYENGTGVEKDEREAVRWYRQAAGKGEPRGQYCLGLMLARGKGVEKDEAEAVRWLRKSAGQGFYPAKRALESLRKKSR
jgi:TPR repeat protein